jgi:aminopeptidase N
MLRRALRVAALTAALVAPGALAANAGAQFTPGAEGLGDPFFPKAGNGGYDVSAYDVGLSYQANSGKIDAITTITASATQDLSSFNLDFRGPQIKYVVVDNAAATYDRDGQELVVTPAAGIAKGSKFETVVAYNGRPRNLIDPDGSKSGWIETDDGVFVASEPQGSPTWFPCNDYPTDKALFEFSITVPKGLEAVANGEFVHRHGGGDHTNWAYRTTEPMATYLATATIGNFRIDQRKVAGLPSVVAVDPRVARASRFALGKHGAILRLWKKLFGPYPFGQTGAIVDHAPDVGYALEVQTRSLFAEAADEATLAHELAHQWFGDSVSLETWPDMWLNEGFATWAEWRWAEARGGPTTKEMFKVLKRAPGSDPLWGFPPAVIPSPAQLFAEPVYQRGAMALEALRQQVGDRVFHATLREWATANAYGNVNTEGFIATAEAVSGEELGELFQRWLFARGKP